MPACVDTLEQLITVPMEQDLVNAVAFLDDKVLASWIGTGVQYAESLPPK